MINCLFEPPLGLGAGFIALCAIGPGFDSRGGFMCCGKSGELGLVENSGNRTRITATRGNV